MTVRLADDGAIRLEGVCAIDDADRLLELRLAHPGAVIDWRDCEQAHTAIIQLLSVGSASIVGPPAGVFLREMIEPLLRTPEG